MRGNPVHTSGAYIEIIVNRGDDRKVEERKVSEVVRKLQDVLPKRASLYLEKG